MRKLLLTVLLGMALTSCTKDEGCRVYEIGVAGEVYETIPTNGIASTIYVDGDKIIQEICY
jgi:hypothetical protein